MACLDTSVLLEIAGRSGRSGAARALRYIAHLRQQGEFIMTTRLNAAELYVGVAAADDPRREEAAVRRLLAPLRILEFDDRAAREYARISVFLSEIGRPIGIMDGLIAAVATTNRQRLITLNVKHFQQIPWLAIEAY